VAAADAHTSPDEALHWRTTLSNPADTIQRPSGDAATEVTITPCPANVQAS
jgi:hypothetical protein